MADVLAAVDSVTGAFGTLVQNRLRADMQTAINTGVTNAIAGSGDTATAVANALAPLTTVTALKAANVVPNSGRNLITGWFHADGYGALHNDAADDRAAIQAAIDAANASYVASGKPQKVFLGPFFYRIGFVPYFLTNGTQYGATGLVLKSGVILEGEGTIKALDASYGPGALLALVRSPEAGIQDASIRGLTFDGRRSANVTSNQSSNVTIDHAISNIRIENVQCYEANGNGIMVTGTAAVPAKDIVVKNCRVRGCNTIGIQVSQFEGLDIEGNIVSYCNDNGIDIYNENGTTTPTGGGFRISNNRVFECFVGIFPETVAFGMVSNNYCYNNTAAGIHVNRINGAVNAVTIMGNECSGGPIGIQVTGDMFPGGVYIRGNAINNVSGAGIQLGGGGSALSYIYVADNFIDMATINTGALVLIASGTTTWSQSAIRRTMTKNTERARDVVNYATTTAGSVSYDQANT